MTILRKLDTLTFLPEEAISFTIDIMDIYLYILDKDGFRNTMRN